ncbi:MAG: alanine dehydrogenase [Planctomycetota bacterium]|nr:alanine dehydrogenase [Planctomycetota bacterium]
MKIGVVKEIKVHEYRVALTPDGVQELKRDGHEVIFEAGAGIGSGLDDSAYIAAGAESRPDAASVFAEAEMIVKVKEPQPVEVAMMREGQIMFTYLHLAADKGLTEGLMASGSQCFSYETLEVNGGLPLLEPMSEVAGRLAIQAGAKFLEKPTAGTGVLLGGVPGVRPARVVVIGGGTVGTNAARMAAGLGADVVILDVNLERMRYLDEILPPNCTTLFSTGLSLREELKEVDLLVGAVLVPGAAAPKLVRKEDLELMKPGSVIVDVAIDQGGCVETARATTHDEPIFIIDDVVHYCVANMPGAVPRTSTYALTNATLPWMRLLAKKGHKQAILDSEPMAKAANVIGGKLCYGAVAEAFGMEYSEPADLVS